MCQRKCLNFRSLALVLLCTLFWVVGARAPGPYEAELAKAEQAYNEDFLTKLLLW